MSITNPSLAIWPIWANYGFGGWIPISSSLSDASQAVYYRGSARLRPLARGGVLLDGPVTAQSRSLEILTRSV